ncbi:uncharacterized protein LOC133830440 [Humulus lupulus]|uniref:uncharacterized protein LOC133830440 n=1 Tax=Humulus lupulus TaxID=3486 RepID=UPI002B4171A3|nr:uncharacterized protein LOC133830440 [Humulus lupulus]
MEKGSSSETSWADQWDPNPDPVHDPKKNGASGSGANYKQKVGEGFVKTKAVASSGVKKVKEGTSVGFQWIKSKYQKTTQKH